MSDTTTKEATCTRVVILGDPCSDCGGTDWVCAEGHDAALASVQKQIDGYAERALRLWNDLQASNAERDNLRAQLAEKQAALEALRETAKLFSRPDIDGEMWDAVHPNIPIEIRVMPETLKRLLRQLEDRKV